MILLRVYVGLEECSGALEALIRVLMGPQTEYLGPKHSYWVGWVRDFKSITKGLEHLKG